MRVINNFSHLQETGGPPVPVLPGSVLLPLLAFRTPNASLASLSTYSEPTVTDVADSLLPAAPSLSTLHPLSCPLCRRLRPLRRRLRTLSPRRLKQRPQRCAPRSGPHRHRLKPPPSSAPISIPHRRPQLCSLPPRLLPARRRL